MGFQKFCLLFKIKSDPINSHCINPMIWPPLRATLLGTPYSIEPPFAFRIT